MKKECSRPFCCFIAIVILFSGMFLEAVQSDSCLSYIQFSDVAFRDSGGTESPLGEPCTLQMIGNRKNSSRENFSVQINKKREIQELTLFLCAILLAYHFLESREMYRILQLPARCSEGVISHYIQNQDGKKRISLT